MRAVALMLDEHDARVAGPTALESPRWTHVKFPDGLLRIPSAISAFFPASTLVDAPVVVEIDQLPSGRSGLFVYTRAEHAAEGQRVLEMIQMRSWGRDNPYLHRYLRASYLRGSDDVELSVVPAPSDERSDLILPDRIWDEIDANIHGLFARPDVLDELGLGMNRGVLLAGPPGTGKTQLCRVVAAELLGEVTVLVADPAVTTGAFSPLYRIAEKFAPTLVVIEDIDVIVGRRGSSPSPALTSFLVELDGAMTAHNGVVTLATTNNPAGIDEAARRAARFDRIVEFPLPSRQAREVILRRYLSRLAEGLDLGRAVTATDGATGADLRELVRLAVLRHGEEITSERLVELARAGEWLKGRVGQYL